MVEINLEPLIVAANNKVIIKIAIIYKLYKIYSVESLKSCDFSYSSLKMMSILVQQRMPVIMLFFGIMKSY